MISFNEFFGPKTQLQQNATEEEKNQPLNEKTVSDTETSDLVLESSVEDTSVQPLEEKAKEKKDEGYLLYRDKQENFSCDIVIEGAKLNQSEARIIVESEEWNLVFPGKIVGNKCVVPLKKMSIFEDGFTGKIRLEVIAEDTLFVPWEENFTVKTSKRVMVKLHESESANDDKTKIKIHNIQRK